MKLVIRILITLCIVSLELFSTVKLNSANSFIKGEPFIFEFEVSGASIKFPKIEKIDKYVVQSLGTSKSIQILNGNYSEKISQKFQILPQDEFTIPSFTFKIDGINLQSASKKIVEEKPTKTISSDFDLKLIASKQQAYVGEDILLKLVFKYKKNLQITNLGFEPPHFENFWYEKLDNKNSRYEQGDYIVHELQYLLFAQKQGKLEVKPLAIIAQIATQNSSFQSFSFLSVPTEKKIYSNPLEFEIKPLPSNTNLIGDFDIVASVDKQKVKPFEPVSLKLKITGFGNFDDIEDYKLNIPNATVYDNKAKIKKSYSNKGLQGTYEKSFSIIPSNSTTIEAFTINYFDKKLNKVVEKKTKNIQIEVEPLAKQEPPSKLQKAKTSEEVVKVVQKPMSLKDKILYFSLGSLATILIFGLYVYAKIYKQKTKEDKPLIKKLKSCKNKEQMLKLLLPYLKIDPQLDELIFECEKTKDFKNSKKRVISLVEQLDIKG